MSAHLRPLGTRCQWQGCTAVATEEAYNTYNAPQGKYCRRHARLRLKELLAGERRPQGDNRRVWLTTGERRPQGDTRT